MRGDEIGRLKDGEVLGHGLSRHGQASRELAQGLTLSRVDPIEELPPAVVGQGSKNARHRPRLYATIRLHVKSSNGRPRSGATPRSTGEKSGSKRIATVYTIAPCVRTPEQV